MQSSAGESHILSFSIIFAGMETGLIRRFIRSAINRWRWPDRASRCYQHACIKYEELLKGRRGMVSGFELRRCFVSRQQQSGHGFRFLAHNASSMNAEDQNVLRNLLIEQFNKEFQQDLS